MADINQPSFGVADASFQAAGGEAGIKQLVEDFYQIMDSWPPAQPIRQLHPTDLTLAKDKLATFLSGWLGGPRRYAEKYGNLSIPQFHSRWDIKETEKELWLSCMQQAIERQSYSPAFADYLIRQLRIPAQRIEQASQNRRLTTPHQH